MMMTHPVPVLPQVDQRGVRLRADRTAVRLLPRMRPKMSSEGKRFGEALPAAVTLEWPLPRVRPNVNCQLTLVGEALRAPVTLEWPLPRVPSHVLHQVAGGGEGLRADGAGELPLLRRPPWLICGGGSGVGGGDVLRSSSSIAVVVEVHVTLQVAQFGEGFWTEHARVGPWPLLLLLLDDDDDGCPLLGLGWSTADFRLLIVC